MEQVKNIGNSAVCKCGAKAVGVILFACLAFIAAGNFCHGQENDTPDNMGTHYVIGYDCSGTMVLEKYIRRGIRYTRYINGYRQILADVNKRILDFLKNDLSANDRITVAYLGFRTSAQYKQARNNGSANYFFNNLVYIPEPTFQSRDHLETLLEKLRDKMSENNFRREFSFPTVQRQALMKIVAPEFKGSHTRLIWVTDGVTNAESSEFTDEIAVLEGNNLQNVVGLRDEIEGYYNFKSKQTARIKHIQVLYFDVEPKDTNIQILHENGRLFDGFKEEYSPFSPIFGASFDLIPVLISWNQDTGVQFIRGFYSYSQGDLSQALFKTDFKIDPNRVAKELDYPKYTQLFMSFQFKDKYGNHFVVKRGPYAISFFKSPWTSALWKIALVVLLAAIALLLLVILLKRSRSRILEAIPLPVNMIGIDKSELNCEAKTGENTLTVNTCFLYYDKLERLPHGKSMRVKVKVSGEYPEDRKCKILSSREVVFFENKQAITEVELMKDEKYCPIPLLINLYCLEDVPIDITLEIIEIPPAFKEFYILTTKPFKTNFILSPNPDDPIKLWKWEFKKTGDPDIPVSVKEEDEEVLLGRIRFTKNTGEGEKEANEDELSELVDYLTFQVENPVCFEVDSGIKVDIKDDDAIFFKSSDPSIRDVGVYCQIYMDSKKVKIKKKSQITFRVNLESKDKDKVKIAKDSDEYQITTAPDYGDLYMAVDFGTTATTCVYGRPRGADLSGKRAVLERGESGEPRYMIDSVLLVDVSTPDKPRVVVGGDAYKEYYDSKGENRKLFHSFKTLIGRKELNINGHKVKIQDIMVGIYQDLYKRLCLYNEDRIKREDIKRIAAAVPNSFPPNKIKLVKESWAKVRPYEDKECTITKNDEVVFEKDNISIIQEAEAVVVFYTESAEIEGTKRILACDNGGGTLDLGLVDILRFRDKDGNFKIKTELIQKCGYKLGGDTLDQFFAKLIWGFYATEFVTHSLTEDLLFSPSCPDIDKSKRADLKNLAKKLKEYYSSDITTAGTGEKIYNIFKVDFNNIINYLDTSDEELKREFNDNIENYKLMAVDESLDDLLSGNPIDNKIDEVIYTGRGGLFKGLKEGFIQNLRDRGVLKEEEGDCYPLENLFRRISGKEDLTHEDMLKYSVAFGALCFSWRKGRELVLSTPKNYGTFFFVQGYDKEMEYKLKQELEQIVIDKDESRRGKVFISLIKNGEAYKKDHKHEWWFVTGETKCAKATGGNCDIFYGQGANFVQDYSEDKHYKYERVAQFPGDARYSHLKMTLYDDSSWIIRYDGAVVEDSKKEVKMYVPLSDNEIQKYWPYTKDDFTDEG